MKFTKQKEANEGYFEQEVNQTIDTIQDLPLELLAKTFSYLSIKQILHVLPSVSTKM
jgi:hypothetical protein